MLPDITAIFFYGLLLVFGLLVMGNLFTGVWQDYFIFRPRRLPEDHRFRFEHPWEEFTVPAARGGRLHGLRFRRAGSKGVVLYCHGNAGSVARWGHYHQYFFRFGYDFVVYDYRGFGKSKGMRREGLLYEDAFAVYEWVRARYSAQEIILFGRSLGSTFATRLAAGVPARLLILETPFAGMVDLFYTYYPFLPRLFRFKYRFENLDYLRRVTMPVFIFQGTNDYIVPMRCAGKLRAALKPGDAFITVEKGRHNDLIIYDLYNQKMRQILGDPVSSPPKSMEDE